jgi:hypothetical protein
MNTTPKHVAKCSHDGGRPHKRNCTIVSGAASSKGHLGDNATALTVGVSKDVMNLYVTAPTLLLVIAGCSPRAPVIQQPQPQSRDSLLSDTARARIESDSALARIIDSLNLAGQARSVCRMPVVRGDSSLDRGMVVKLPRSGPIPGVPRYTVCHNPLFRDSS